MAKITKIHTEEPTNFQGYYLDEDGTMVVEKLRIKNVELNSQSDDTLIGTSKITGDVTTFLDINRDSEQSVTKVFSSEIVEDSTTAFQPSEVDTVLASTFNTGRQQWQHQFDIQADSDRHTLQYRGKSTTGINNVRVLVYSLTPNDPTGTDQEGEYNELIAGQWWMSKTHIWSTRKKREVIDERVKKADSDYTSLFDLVPDGNGYITLNVDVTYEKDKYYRILVCGDDLGDIHDGTGTSPFDLKGVNNVVDDPVNGGKQFFLYTERTYQNITSVTGSTSLVEFALDDTIDFERDGTNTTIVADNGDSFNVNTIKAVPNANGFIDINTLKGTKLLYTNINHENVTIAGVSAGVDIDSVINALNALFTVTQGQLTTAITSPEVDNTGVATTDNTYTNIVDPIGDASYALGSGSHGVVYTDDRINEAGEYFTFSIVGKNYYGLGLFDDTTDTDGDGTSDHLAELQSQTTSRYLGNQFSLWIHPTTAAWTNYGENTSFANMEGYGNSDPNIKWQTSVEYTNLATTPVTMKVGINNLGYLVVYYFNVAENRFVPIRRTSYQLKQANYGLYLALGSTASTVWDAPKVHLIDEADPILAYYTIQSTDWKYPLFTTAEQANFYDLQNGGTGTSTIQIFPDDPSNGTWYAPDNGYTSNGASQPANTEEVIYNVIPSEVQTPVAYTDTTYEVNEGETFNIPIDPLDHNWNTEITGESWAVLHGENLTGTAPTVSGDNVTNPNDEYTFTVTRELEGTSQGTLTIRVINLTVPVNPISGFSHVSGTTAMIDSDTMNDGSVVQLNTQVNDAERFIIYQSYVETNILPALQASGDQYIIGLHKAASDFSTLEIADFDAAIVWEYESATSHTFKFYRGGSVVQNVVVNSMTDAYYDYAIEADGTSAWLIACNVNSIMNEPSPNDGGSFSFSYEVTNTEDQAPLQIHVAALNTTADISLTGIETLDTPTPPVVTNDTSWTKAIDFSGGSEHLAQNSTSIYYTPLMMGGTSTIVAAPTPGQTVSVGHPWATAIVFTPDNNSTNQHIWNLGEGSGATDDNIYLRQASNGNIFFGWGRDGAVNECIIWAQTDPSKWFGIYIGFNGTRLNATDAADYNTIKDCFNIRVWADIGATSYPPFERSNQGNWSSFGQGGGRMDRQFGGIMTIGGRGSNRSWHGKVARMVVTTLKVGVAMPDDTEIEMMLTDPIKWVSTYKVGQTYRLPANTYNSTVNFAIGGSGGNGTQVWQMGDGTLDAYPTIRSYTNENASTSGQAIRMIMQSQVSNDIENVTINGLT